MASPSPKIIVVIGGTGNLGSSVARSLHENKDFHVRVVSRDPESAKATKLSDLGIEVVKGDAWKAEELQNAFTNGWGVFINIDSDVPNFKQKIGPPEVQLGKLIIDEAAKAGISHAVHASLPAASKLTGGKVPLTSFDDKAAISEYMLEPGKFMTATVLSAGWFMENAFDPKYNEAFGGFAMVKDSEGFLTWETPAMGNDPESVPFLAVADDYGDFVHGVFLDPERWNRKYLHGVSNSSSFSGMTATFQAVTGKPARYKKPAGELKAHDEFKTKEVNGLFDLMHAINGNFFNGIPTIHEDARTLKSEAAKATGRTGDAAKPMTLEAFFRKYAM